MPQIATGSFQAIWLGFARACRGAGPDCGPRVIDVPFPGRRNGKLQAFAERSGIEVRLHDDGRTLKGLGPRLDLISPDFSDRPWTILHRLRVKLDGNRLSTCASENKAGQGLHNLVQAMLHLMDMHMPGRTQPHKSTFSEAVLDHLESKSVRFAAQVQIAGRSGYLHAVDCIVPTSKKAPERIFKAINAPNKNKISNCLFILVDAIARRSAQGVAVLNDADTEVEKEVLDALEESQVIPAFWSKEEDLVKLLAA